MAGFTNKWITPYQRSYSAIKEKLISAIKGIKVKDPNNPQGEEIPIITDYSEGNILILIISLFAGIAEIIHYYIDNIARESFLTTCRRYDSLIKHANLVGYYPKGATAARVELTMMLSKVVEGKSVNITKDQIFTDNNGNKWMIDSKNDIIWDVAKSTIVKIPLIQHEPASISVNTEVSNDSSGVLRITINNPSNGYIEHGSISEIEVGGDIYKRVDNFARHMNENVFLSYYDPTTGNTIIQFGDGVFGNQPFAGLHIDSINCYLTKGLEGNINSNAITFVPNNLGLNNIVVNCTNVNRANGGSNGESFDDIKRHVPQSIRTLDIAVTKQDIKDLAELYPGVDQALVDYERGRKVVVYIKPINGVSANDGLCREVEEYLKEHSPLTNWLEVKKLNSIELHMSMEVTGRSGYKYKDIKEQVETALMNFNYSLHIGDNVRISDIYALIDNLPMVDYLHISEFYSLPQVTTLYGNTDLQISEFILNYIKGKKTFLVQFTGKNTFIMYPYYSKGEVNWKSGEVGKDIQYEDEDINFKMSIGPSTTKSYDDKFRYILNIGEPNMDILTSIYNIPNIGVGTDNINISINETL